MLGGVLKEFASPGTNPSGLTWVPGSTGTGASLYVSASDASGNGHIYQVDPATGAIQSSFAPPVPMYGLTYDGQYLWGADVGDNLLVQFSTSGTEIKTLPAPAAEPSAVVWDGTDLWVSFINSGQIDKVDPSNGSVLATISTTEAGFRGLALDGSHFWASDVKTEQVMELDPSNGAVLRAFTPPSDFNSNLPVGLAYDGSALWMAQITSSQIFRVDASSPGEQAVTLADSAATASGVDFGDFRLGSISGTIANAQGGPLTGWTAYVDTNGDGQYEAWEPAAMADASGNYIIGGLLPGTYTVSQIVRQPGWSQTTPAASSVTIDSSGQAIGGQSFTDTLSGLGPLGAEAPANATTAGVQQTTSIGAVSSDGAGNYVVAWQGPTSTGGSGVFARLFNSVGTPLTGEILVNSVAPGSPTQHNIYVAMNGSDDFAVAWADNFNVYGQTFNAQGTSLLKGPVTVFAASSTTLGNSYGVGIDSSANFGVYYYTGAAGFSTKLNHIVPAFDVQLYTASGAARLRKPIQVGTDNCNGCGVGSLAMAPDGTFAVAWHSIGGVYAQRFGATGSLVGSRITVTTSGLYPSLGMDASGNFVVSWEVNTTATQAYQAQYYASNGAPIGPVLSYTTLNVGSGWTYPVATSGGTVLFNYPSGDGEILAQRYSVSSSGWTPIDSQPFIVNETLVGDHQTPSCEMIGNGGFVVVWSGPGIGDDSGVFVQRYGTASVAPAAILAPAANSPVAAAMALAPAGPSRIETVVDTAIEALSPDPSADGPAPVVLGPIVLPSASRRSRGDRLRSDRLLFEFAAE